MLSSYHISGPNPGKFLLVSGANLFVRLIITAVFLMAKNILQIYTFTDKCILFVHIRV